VREIIGIGSLGAGIGKIATVVQATNFLATVSFAVNFKNRAEKQFGRKLFDCETNGGGPLARSVCT
jgi:hypothetical protein